MMLKAELVKARTTRTSLSLAIGAVATAALGTASMVLSQPAAQIGSEAIHEQQFYLITTMVVIAFAGVLGVRSFTDEFRYGSVVPTFLVQPRRGRVLAAKALAAALLGFGIAVVAQAVMLGVGVGLAGTKGAALGLIGADVIAMLGLSVAAALWAALGVGIGAAVRHQIVGIVGVILWLVVVENLMPNFVGDAAAFLPGRAAYALADAAATTDLLSRGVGAAVLGGYAAAAGLLGGRFLRRDVEAA